MTQTPRADHSHYQSGDGYHISVWGLGEFLGSTQNLYQGTIILADNRAGSLDNLNIIVPSAVGVTCETVASISAPVLEGAAVKNRKLTLTFDRELDSGSTPAASAFTLIVNGTTSASVSAVGVSGRTVTLTLTSAVGADDTLTVGYSKPSTNPLRGNIVQKEVASFGAQTVTINTPVNAVKTVANTGQGSTGTSDFQSDYVQGFTTGSGTGGYKLTRVDLLMGLTTGTSPQYSVSIHRNLPSGPKLATLTKSSSLGYTLATVQFTYSSGVDLAANTTYWVVMDSHQSVSNAILGRTTSKSEDSNPSAGWSISDTAGTRSNPSGVGWNSSTSLLRVAVYGYAKTTPAISSAAVNGTSLTLTFSEPLDSGATPATSAFSVTIAGSTRTLTSGGVAISGKTVTLTLSSAVTSGQTVTVSYTRPSSNKLQHAGRFAPSFSNQSVTNNTP